MKLIKILIVAAAVCALPVMVWADGCPASGGYWSTLSGMYPGHGVVSNCGGGGLQIGDMMDAASWDGVTVGSQWTASGLSLSSVTFDNSGINPADGSGLLIASTTYSGGVFALDPNGPWGHYAGSFDDIGGVFDSVFGTVYITRLPGGITADVYSTINATGHITSCGPDSDCRVIYSFSQNLQAWQGDPATGNPLSNYPAFPLCQGSLPPLASQWNMCQVGFSLECTVASEPTSWGSLKAQYK